MAVNVVVADGDPAASLPQPGLGALGAAHCHSLTDLFSLKLSEDREDADHRTAERCGGVEVLGHRDKIASMIEEDVLNHVQRVLLRPREAVEPVDQHAVDAPRLHVLNELREGRPLHVGAGEAGVGVGVENPPALGLAVRLQAFCLGLDGVAFHGLLLRGYADVDGSTRWHDIDLSAAHMAACVCSTPWAPFP